MHSFPMYAHFVAVREKYPSGAITHHFTGIRVRMILPYLNTPNPAAASVFCMRPYG